MDNKKTIKILVLIIIILALFIAYAFIVRPALSGYAVEKQNEGIDLVVSSIMQQASSCQPFPLRYKNQTVNLIAVECLQAPETQGGL